MNQKKNKFLFLDHTQIYKYNINEQDLKDCIYDSLKLGYWVPKDSKQEIWLTLKGLTLRKIHYDLNNRPPKIFKVK